MVEQKQRELFSIAGWMESEHVPANSENPSTRVAFGGYLVRQLDFSFTGQLIDIYGGALIKGNLTELGLDFTKIYEDGPSWNAVVKYQFDRRQNGMWVGHYDFSQGPDKTSGNSKCSTSLDIREANDINSPLFDEERLRLVENYAGARDLLSRIAAEDALTLYLESK